MPVTANTPIGPPAPQPPSVLSPIASAIQRAAQATGASFEYLLATAKVESNLNPNVAASTSSATGLFQFVEQTWLATVSQAGRALGLGNYADAISRDSAGRYQVADARLRNEIMQLRTDLEASAAMAAVFTQQNAAQLRQRLGRNPTDGELYMAHFIGSAGAVTLISAVGENPQGNAAAMFPAAARANRSVFYDREGRARSVAGVYAELNRRYQVARTQVAPAVAASPAVAATPRTNVGAPARSPVAPDPAATSTAFAAAADERSAPASPPQPIFRSLFHTGELRGPVSPVVSELWGAPAPRGPAGAAQRAAPVVAPPPTGGPLDLFQEIRPDTRGLFTSGGRS
jgi:hypothetical protein